MNNRNKMRFLIGFLMVLTGLLGLEVWRGVKSMDQELDSLGLQGTSIVRALRGVDSDWTFEIKGLAFGLFGYLSGTFIVFANHYFRVAGNFYVVAGALVVVRIRLVKCVADWHKS